MQRERSLICRVLYTGRMRQAVRAGVLPEHFHRYRTEWEYLLTQYNRHSEVPTPEVFCERFVEFQYKKPRSKNVKIRPAVEAVIENHTAIRLAKALEQTGNLLDEKPAIELLEAHIKELQDIYRGQASEETVDIIEDVEADIAEFERLRAANESDELHAFIPTPWPTVNNIWGGWREGELIAILARPNIGKSWTAIQAGAYAAVKGYRPFVAPLEMKRFDVAMRIHTLASFYAERAKNKGKKKNERLTLPAILDHDGVRQLMAGREIFTNQALSMGHNSIDAEAYREFAMSLKKLMPKGIVLPDLKTRSSAYTMQRFLADLERSEADIGVLDYLTLLEDSPGRNGQAWEMWNDVTAKLKMAAERMGIPIVICIQANRSGALSKTPEISDIGFADGIGMNCDRIISLSQAGGSSINLTNIKNRQGPKDWRIQCHFYPDFGIIEENRHVPVEWDVV